MLAKRDQRQKNTKKKNGSLLVTLLSFGVVVVALAAVIVVSPSDFKVGKGEVKTYVDLNKGEPFGPDIPKNFVNTYVEPVVKPVVLPEATEGPDSTVYVYSTDKQENYHLWDCAFAYASGRRMTLYEAYYMGKTPGKCCDAPAFSGTYK